MLKKIFSLAIILFLCTSCLFNNIYKTKDDISRVNNGVYIINYNEFLSYLKEAYPRTNFKEEVKQNKSKGYYGVIQWDNFKIECNFPEESGNITSVYLSSPEGIKKQSKTVALRQDIEFKTNTIHKLRNYSVVINNILNSSNTQNDIEDFLNSKLKKKLERGTVQIGDSEINLRLSGTKLLIVFKPINNGD